jgi:hypothetical protein
MKINYEEGRRESKDGRGQKGRGKRRRREIIIKIRKQKRKNDEEDVRKDDTEAGNKVILNSCLYNAYIVHKAIMLKY